jgi:RHS repeat-associated protein
LLNGVLEADVVTATDYYPFGMTMPGRTFSANSTSYRYGFNGKENDGSAFSTIVQDYGFRIYNPAIGKFLSVDPLTEKYPYYTPYQFAGNMPIWATDLDGAEPNKKTGTLNGHFNFNFVGGAKNLSDAQKNTIKQEIIARLNTDIALGNYSFEGKNVIGNFSENQGSNKIFNRNSDDWQITINVNLSSDRSNANYGTGIINLNIGKTFDERDVSAIWHETAHIFGLADRYQPVGYFSNFKRADPKNKESEKQYHQFNLTGYVPLAIDPNIEKDYYGKEKQNLMFGDGNLLSKNQLNIMFNSQVGKPEDDIRTAFLTRAGTNSTALTVRQATFISGPGILTHWKVNGNNIERFDCIIVAGCGGTISGFYRPEKPNLSDQNHQTNDPNRNVSKYSQTAIKILKDAF